MEWLDKIEDEYADNIVIDEFVWVYETKGPVTAINKVFQDGKTGLEFVFGDDQHRYLSSVSSPESDFFEEHWVEAKEILKKFPETENINFSAEPESL